MNKNSQHFHCCSFNSSGFLIPYHVTGSRKGPIWNFPVNSLVFFFQFTFYFILCFVLLLFTSVTLRVVKIRGPWTRSIFWWTWSMDPIQRRGGPWTKGSCFVLSRQSQSDITDEQLDSKVRAFLNEHGCLVGTLMVLGHLRSDLFHHMCS